MAAVLAKKLGVLAATYSIKPSSTTPAAKRNADFAEEAFARMQGSPQTILYGAMDAFSKGWSIQECIYREGGTRWWLEAVRPKDPSLFGLEMDRFGKLEGLRLEMPGDAPITLPKEKFVVYAHRSGYGFPKGKSDLDAAYINYSAKTTLLAAWRIHLEKFASPTMLAAFGTGATHKERDAILAALNALDQTRAMVYPNEFAITSIGGTGQATQGFLDAIDYHNREIARAILGQTLTTDEGRRVGSLALGRVHLQVLLLQLESLRKDLADRVMTEQIIRPLIEMNFGPEDIPTFEFEPIQVEAFRSGRLD